MGLWGSRIWGNGLGSDKWHVALIPRLCGPIAETRYTELVHVCRAWQLNGPAGVLPYRPESSRAKRIDFAASIFRMTIAVACTSVRLHLRPSARYKNAFLSELFRF